MDAAVECTHCRATMTSWSAPGSPIRYFKCPFCARTHSSAYGEVFRRGGGARPLSVKATAAVPQAIPMASAEDIRWSAVRSTAARWFARLEAEEALARSRPGSRPARVAEGPALAAAAAVGDALDFDIDVALDEAFAVPPPAAGPEIVALPEAAPIYAVAGLGRRR